MAYEAGYQLGKNKDYFYLVNKKGKVVAQGSIFEIAAVVKQYYESSYNPLYTA
jgi:hypothetical protein